VGSYALGSMLRGAAEP